MNGVKRLRVAVLFFCRIGNVVVGTLVGLVLAQKSAKQGLIAEMGLVGAVRVSSAHRVVSCCRIQLHKRVRA